MCANGVNESKGKGGQDGGDADAETDIQRLRRRRKDSQRKDVER